MTADKIMTSTNASSVQPKNLTVMIVDDDDDILQIMKKGLELSGYKVHTFSIPIEAIQHLESENNSNGGCKECTILISDIRMPQLNGFQLVRRVKELRPEMKIIMMTAFEVNMKEFNMVFPSTHVNNIIRKPFKISTLVEMVDTIQLKAQAQWKH